MSSEAPKKKGLKGPFIAAGFVLVLFVAGLISIALFRKDLSELPTDTTGTVATGENTTTPEPTMSEAIPTESLPSAPTGTSAPPKTSEPPDVMAAVTAADYAQERLCQGQFYPEYQLKPLVGLLVVPRQQGEILRDFPKAAEIQAYALGYPNVEEANLRTKCSTETWMYRVESFKNNKASVSLFMNTALIDGLNRLYQAPSLTVMHMEKVDGKWLYASSNPAPDRPTFEPGVHHSTAELLEIYAPYLEGFKNYDSEF